MGTAPTKALASTPGVQSPGRFISAYFLPHNNQVMSSFENKKGEGEDGHKKGLGGLPGNENLTSNQKQELRQVYMCSCGKQYQSFPAVYLHFRSKHDIKLSIKPDEPRKVVQIEGDLRKITYTLEIEKQSSTPSPQNHPPRARLASPAQVMTYLMARQEGRWPEAQQAHRCIREYLGPCRQDKLPLYEKLLLFLEEKHSEAGGGENGVSISKIPYFLNDFALYCLPQYYRQIPIGSEGWRECCRELKSFCDWLNKEKYTDLLLILAPSD